MKNKKSYLVKIIYKKSFSIIVILLNVIFLSLAVILYGRYLSVYSERLKEENLGNISNLNQSAASNVMSLISSWSIKLDDIDKYTSKHAMTAEEVLCTIDDENSSSDRNFQLIGSDYTGFSAKRDAYGNFIPVSYKESSYADLQKAFDDYTDTAYGNMCFTPEFTDSETALKYFAVYKHINLKDEDGKDEVYTLLLASKSSGVLAVFNGQNDYENQSTVLIDSLGNYIVSNKDFKSTNFFEYLYVYNDLTLDSRNEIKQNMQSNTSGELYYKNAVGVDCVFRYEKMEPSNWYCITSVPISEFRVPIFNVNYIIEAVIMLLLMLCTDILWLRKINHSLRVSMLREKEASNAKTDFLSRMSHDIRTPLNGIIGLTTLAMDETVSPQIREYLYNIKVSGEFLTGLVNDILDMSKVESGKIELHPEPYSNRELHKYLQAVVVPLCREKNHTFKTTPQKENTSLMLDRLRFNQIVFNLLSNAVKYTPDGGIIELYWERKNLDNGRASLDIIVKDNGIGMSEEFQKHMFESFTQEHIQTANTGAGLGLAIVNSLVKLMKGSIEVKSKKGEGSTFIVHLEADICKEHTAEQLKINCNTLSGKKVLLCEDNRINVLVAKKLLEKWGITIDEATNGEIGLQKFSESSVGEYDAVLMDIMMPEMNGLDATKAIRSLQRADARTVPIIAMTANAYDSDVANCMSVGMNAHIGKPIDTERLKIILCELTNNKSES